jgi:iron complex transport system substrate-binding protein
VDKLEKSGSVVIAIKEENRLEGMLDAMQILGKIVDNQRGADSLVAKYSTQLDKYKDDGLKFKVQSLKLPTVYYVVGFGAGGDYTAPANSHIHEIITLAGGRNIGDSLSNWHISREYLFVQDPDVIFVRTEELPHFVKTYPYTLLTAVKENRVYPIESGWMDVISPRNFLAVEEIRSKISQ